MGWERLSASLTSANTVDAPKSSTATLMTVGEHPRIVTGDEHGQDRHAEGADADGESFGEAGK